MKLVSTLGAAALAAVLTAGLVAPAATADASDVRRAAAKPTLKASSAQVVAGHRLVLAGKVRPAKKGRVVVLQKRVGDKKKWVVEARLKTSRTGTFTYRDKPKAAGVRHYRVVVPKIGASKQVKVTVYRWKSLAWSGQRAHRGTYHSKSVVIGNTEYGHSFTGLGDYQDGFIDFNLGRDCLKVRARYGNSDDSDDLAVAHISVVADGASVYAKSFALTESEVATIDIRGVFRLSFDWTSTNPSGTPEDQSGAAAVFVEPKALCAF